MVEMDRLAQVREMLNELRRGPGSISAVRMDAFPRLISILGVKTSDEAIEKLWQIGEATNDESVTTALHTMGFGYDGRTLTSRYDQVAEGNYTRRHVERLSKDGLDTLAEVVVQNMSITLPIVEILAIQYKPSRVGMDIKVHVGDQETSPPELRFGTPDSFWDDDTVAEVLHSHQSSSIIDNGIEYLYHELTIAIEGADEIIAISVVGESEIPLSFIVSSVPYVGWIGRTQSLPLGVYVIFFKRDEEVAKRKDHFVRTHGRH